MAALLTSSMPLSSAWTAVRARSRATSASLPIVVRRPDAGEERRQRLGVRARPDDPTAVGAAGEAVEGGPAAWRHALGDGSQLDRLELSVAAHAAGRHGEVRDQPVAAHDLDGLLVGIVGAGAVPVAHDPAHQQAAVTRQQDALVVDGDA